MFENLKLRWFLITASLVFGFYFTFPTYKMLNSDDSTHLYTSVDNVIGLGLDLKGGLRVVLELDEKKFLSKISNMQSSKFPKDQFNQLLDAVLYLVISKMYHTQSKSEAYTFCETLQKKNIPLFKTDKFQTCLEDFKKSLNLGHDS